MGYLRESQTKKKNRNSDSTQNYVDRVRIPDSSYIFGGPGRGSGWRQRRSLSNIDLTSQTKHSFTKQTREYSSGLYDLYSRIESRKDNKNLYKFSDNSIDNKHSEQIYDQIRPDVHLGPDACSLRRTRSLAVIREETYNDLQITGIRTRRSQLIPRAKLVNRSFFKNRKHKYREEDSGSGVDTQTSETRESDDYYANLKKLDANDKLIIDQPWVNDKSDLDSLESDYFKNSLHQSPVNNFQEKSAKLYVQEFQVHDSKTDSDTKTEAQDGKSIKSQDENVNAFEEIALASNLQDSDSTYGDCELTYNTNTLTLTRLKIRDFGDDDITDKKTKFKEDGKSIVSFDSIYLSSEESNYQTVVQEALEDPLSDVSVNEILEYHNDLKNSVTLEDHDQPSLDSLYSQINKNKPKIISLEPKTHLTSFSDTSTRGTLERLTFISTTPQTQKKDFLKAEGKSFSSEPFAGTLIDNQYCSLPDANIGFSLRASERIDEKLRSSCKILISGDDNNNLIYDSISRFGKAHKGLRQRESRETEDTRPILTEEILKEADIIEVKLPIKPVQNNEKFIEDNNKAAAPALEALPTTINLGNLGKKKIIVDELAAKAHKESREVLDNQPQRLEFTKKPTFSDIKIIVTDAQNNIVEADELIKEAAEDIKELKPQPKEIKQERPQEQRKKEEFSKNRTSNVHSIIKQDIISVKSKNNEPKEKVQCVQPLEPKQSQISKPILKKTKFVEQKDIRSEFKANLTDTLKKRIADSRNIFNARPIRISSEEHIEKLNDTYEINSSLAYKVKFKEQKKMSRPQILTVVDSKRNICSVAPRQQEDKRQSLNNPVQCTGNEKPELEQEFQEKVDSVRCYWSKLIEENGHHDVDEVDHEAACDEHQKRSENVRSYIASVEKQNIENLYEKRDNKKILQDNEDFTSFSPNVEVIELEGHKNAAIVKNQNLDTQDFDHVRYKVMKSDTFQKNILAHSRQEAQFDGLLEYLHNYSFQELLASNNVVIIEPIRTKIEKPSMKLHEPQTVHCKITGGAGRGNESNKKALKKHFFYHPIRVNKELLDEELPNPDTVRKARKLFEGTLRLRNPQQRDDAITGDGTKNNEKLRRKALRYLTIDTSYGDGVKKWDSSSVSSGISSGELSSPCECNDHDEEKDDFSSEENICGYDMCESYYVSQDVLEKIRECGSSITYYGGRVVDNRSPEVSPMTKAIMQEIRGQNKMCGVCQPFNCPHQSKVFPIIQEADKSNLGLKFKLVKSNSCSSRLELAGAGIDEQQLRNTKHHIKSIENRSTSSLLDAEESVRTLVNRLETGAINQKVVPRIIESKCIEKTVDFMKVPESEQSIDPFVSINNQMIDEQQSHLGPVDILRQVTVNNHINFTPPVVIGDNIKTITVTQRHQQHQNNQSAETLRTNKVPRNRNVDLAFAMNKTTKESKEKSDEMKKVITNEMLLEPDDNQQVNKTSFRNAKNLLNEMSDNGTQMTIQVCSRKREIGVKIGNENGGHEQQQSTQSQRQLLKWNTLSSFDEKNYVANDVKLKQKPKYDEIEFEEFEVYDPNKANNECYDSLNDK